MAITLNQVWSLLESEILALEIETIATDAALGRVLAADLRARRAHPHWDIAAMDGYGFIASEQCQTLSLIGVSAAGEPFSDRVLAGQCVRIFTGAAIPEGVDTVAMQEDCVLQGDTVSVPASAPQRFIRQQGCDFAADAELLHAAAKLHSRDLALILAAGHRLIPVRKKSRWRLLATGSELADADTETGTINSNIPALHALLLQQGAEVLSAQTCIDDPVLLQRAIHSACDGDVLLLTGGVSVGDKDLVRPCLEDLGAEILFHGVLMKPGKPSLLARLGNTWVLGLPGNPVSAQVCGHLLALPLLRGLSGTKPCAPEFIAAQSCEVLPKGIARENYLRGVYAHDHDGRVRVSLLANQDSAGLLSLAQANCLVRIATHAPAQKSCAIVPLD